MTGIDPERLKRRLRWAAEQLGLCPDATLDEVRAAWLRRLPAEDFVPSTELRWALAALLRRQAEGGWEARADEAASAAEEERLRGEVEAFAEKFWDLSPAERRKCWQELMVRCEFSPPLQARVRLLEAGLGCVAVVNETKENPRVVELANQVRDLFVLRPGPQAHSRQGILQHMQDERKAWKAAARRLRRSYPKLASLGKVLLDKIIKAKRKPKRLPKIQALQPAVTSAGENTQPGSKWPMWIIVGIAVGIARIVTSVSNQSPTPSTQSVPLNPPFPIRQDKKVPPEVLDKLFEKQSIRDEKLKEELKRNIAEKIMIADGEEHNK